MLSISSLCSCSRQHTVSAASIAACNDLSQKVARQEQEFVDRVRTIRQQHVLLQEYDRQMIDAITDRRSALQSTGLTEMSVTEDVGGCSGQPLEDLRRRAQEQLTSMRVFLNTFKRALKNDPDGLYIDQM